MRNQKRIRETAESMWTVYLHKTLKLPKRYNWKTDPKNVSEQAKTLLESDYAKTLYARGVKLTEQMRAKAEQRYPDPVVE